MKNIVSSIILKKLSISFFLLFIYVLGSRISLPFVDLNSRDFLGGTTAYLAFSTALTGGNLRSLSLFSIGLSPWMSAMILWKMFSFFKGLTGGGKELQDRRQMYLTLLIALIQSAAVVLSLPVQSSYSTVLVYILNISLLCAGSFFLVWLSDINASNGVGGSMLIMLTSMIINMPQDVINSIQILSIPKEVVVLMLLIALVFTYINVILYRARYRVAVNKIGLHSRFKRYSYFEISLTPAGGMPYMYVMTFMTLPIYILMLLRMVDSHNSLYTKLIEDLNIGKPLWIYTYLFILFAFNFLFAFVNMSGGQIADSMKKSGEYIYGIYPGEETSRFINKLIFRFAFIGAVYSIMIAGLPMLFVLYDERFLRLTMIPGLLFMLLGMIFMVREELIALRLNETYKPLI